jgi:hypothetical protein
MPGDHRRDAGKQDVRARKNRVMKRVTRPAGLRAGFTSKRLLSLNGVKVGFTCQN